MLAEGSFFMPVLIMFRSLTYAQRGAKALEKSGINASLIKAPLGTSERGCSYCVRISEGKLYRALDVLQGQGIEHGRILKKGGDGEYREVGL